MLELNQVYCGDCLKMMKGIDDGSVDMVMADPPYGTTACKWDSIIPLEPMWTQLKRVIKPNGAIVLTASQPFTTTLISSNMGMFKYCWYWDKLRGSNFATVKIRPFNSIEDVIVFYSKQATYNPQMWDSAPYKQKQGYVGDAKQTGLTKKDIVTISDGKRYPLSIVRVSKESGLHPTQKPVALMEYLIKTYTNEGDTVLDFCAGSGTTGVACRLNKRNFILIEQEEKYCEIARQRIKNPDYKPPKPKTNQQPGLFPQDEIDKLTKIK